jgi:hypothetical protein
MSIQCEVDRSALVLTAEAEKTEAPKVDAVLVTLPASGTLLPVALWNQENTLDDPLDPCIRGQERAREPVDMCSGVCMTFAPYYWTGQIIACGRAVARIGGRCARAIAGRGRRHRGSGTR